MCFVRLACVRHAASVHPEPGSNSQIKDFDVRSETLVVNHSFKTLSTCVLPIFTVMFRLKLKLVSVRSMDPSCRHHSLTGSE